MSTYKRWINLKSVNVTVGADSMDVNDALGGGIRMTSQVVGSNSENDDYANHFLQGVQLSDEMTVRTFDLAAASWIRSKRGQVAQVTMTIPHASEGASSTDLLIDTSSACGGGALIQSVSISADKDREGEAEIALVFRCNTSGQTSGMSLTTVAG